MNKLQQSHRPLSGILEGAGCFVAGCGAIYYFSDASFASAAQVLIVAGSAIIGVALFKLISFLFRLPAISRLPRSGLLMVILMIVTLEGCILGYFSAPLCKALHVSLAFLDTITGSLQFCLVITLIGALPGRTVDRAPKPAHE